MPASKRLGFTHIRGAELMKICAARVHWVHGLLHVALSSAAVLALIWGHQAFATGDLSVDVKASQWDWKFSVKKLPVDQPVIFNITSSDVSHGFTIYDDAGAVLVQTTVVPGETAHVKYVFTKAGKYPVRCMLYCGMGHDGMKNELTVVEGR